MGTQKAIPTDPVIYAQAVSVIKTRVQRWPSAYASGQVVILYKQMMKLLHKTPYKDTVQKSNTPLARWYKEDWIDIRTGKKCGTHTDAYYPTCRPNKRINKSTPITATELKPKEKIHMIAEKQKAQSKTVHYKETLNHTRR